MKLIISSLLAQAALYIALEMYQAAGIALIILALYLAFRVRN